MSGAIRESSNSTVGGKKEKKGKPKKKAQVEKRMQKLSLQDDSSDCSCSDCACSCSDCANSDSDSEVSSCSCSDCQFSSDESCSCSECDTSSWSFSDNDCGVRRSACALPPSKKPAAKKKKKSATKRITMKSICEGGACPLVKPKKRNSSKKNDVCKPKKNNVRKPGKSKKPSCKSGCC